jgi:hypothetical protein
LANHRQEPWKQPLPQFIERIYFKHFGKACPDRVLSLENWTKQEGAKKQEKKQRRQERREQAHLEAEAVARAAHAGFIKAQIAESGPGSIATSAMPEIAFKHPFKVLRDAFVTSKSSPRVRKWLIFMAPARGAGNTWACHQSKNHQAAHKGLARFAYASLCVANS